LPYKTNGTLTCIAEDYEAGESFANVGKFAADLLQIFKGPPGQDDRRQYIFDFFSTKFDEVLVQRFGRNKMYLYLIDEHSGKIVMGGKKYPNRGSTYLIFNT